MTPADVHKLADRCDEPGAAAMLRSLADIAAMAKKYRPHNHSATFNPNCKLCQALSDLEVLKPWRN